MTEKMKRKNTSAGIPDFLYSEVVRPGQVFHAESRDGGLSISSDCSGSFLAAVLMEILLQDEDQNLINKALLLFGLRLNEDKEIPPEDKKKRMLYTYSLMQGIIEGEKRKLEEEVDSLRAKIAEQKVTIDSLMTAVSFFKEKEGVQK